MTRMIEQDAPRTRLAALLQHFSDLDDSREPWRVMYPLKEVLLLVTCATIASCDDFDEIAEWGEHNLDFLRRFSDYHHGIPCERWLRSLFNRVDPTLFARCFENWVAAQWPGRHEFIAIDGKTARCTHDRRKGFKALHTLSAYATTARPTLAQLSVPEKTNEITAIPYLLDHLAETNQPEGALVTIDAMGCQVDIAETIVAHKAEYLLALKGNQPNLEAEVADYFRDAPDTKLVAKTTVEKGHGRIETRTYSERHAIARSSGRYLCHARRPRLPALLRGLGRGADQHARRGHRDRWQDLAALLSDQGFKRGDPHGLCLRGAATHRAGAGQGKREVERDRRHPGTARHDVD